jgi:hypothetical protein
LQRALLGVTEELHDRRFPFAVLKLDEGETFCAVQLCNFSKLICLAYGDSGKTFCVDCLYDAARVKRTAKNFKTAVPKIFTKIDQLHFKPAIGFIAAVTIEHLTICKPVEWRFDVDVARGFEDRREHSFGDRKNVLRRDERRFDVDLRKLRLPVRAQIFVTETFCDLKIFFHACNHQQLLVLLGRLRQRIKFPRRNSAWHQEVPRTFRRAFGQNRSFNFHEALAVEVIARRFCGPVTNPQIARQPLPTQIQIAVRHPQIFILRLGIEWEWQRFGAI